MNVNDYLSHSAENLTAKWETYEDLDKKERLKLYEDTQDLFEKLPEKTSPDLQEKVDKLRKFILEEGFDSIISKKYPELSRLLKKSKGPSLHHLLSADHLKDLTPSIYSGLSLKELLGMRQTSKATKKIAEIEIIRRINESAPTDLNSLQAASRSLNSLMEEAIINRMNLASGNFNINARKSDEKVKLDLSKLKISTLKELRSFFDEAALKGLIYLDVAIEPSENAQSVSQLITENLIEIIKSCPSLQALTLRDRPLLSTNTNSSTESSTNSSTESSTEAKSKKSKSKSVFSKFSLSGLLKKKSDSVKENDVSLSKKSNPLEAETTCGIKILELSYIKEIGENRLTDVNFLKLFPELEQLSLEGCEFINNTKGLIHCEKLSHLDIRNAFKIDDLEAVVNKCPNLQIIDIHGLNNIPEEQLAALKQRNIKFTFSF